MNDNEEKDLRLEQSRLRRQQKLVPLFFTQTEAERLNAFAERHRPTEPIVFFREQVLALIRWVVLICRDEPGGELGGADREELNRRFTKALLIAATGLTWGFGGDSIGLNDASSSLNGARRKAFM